MKKGIFYIPCYPQKAKTSLILDEIKESIKLCEKNNFNEAFFGEHLADKHEKISSSLMMISAVSSITKNIKLGSLTTNLNFYHPAVLASQISMIDNLIKGKLCHPSSCGKNAGTYECIIS